jgi:hypothetical protein
MRRSLILSRDLFPATAVLSLETFEDVLTHPAASLLDAAFTLFQGPLLFVDGWIGGYRNKLDPPGTRRHDLLLGIMSHVAHRVNVRCIQFYGNSRSYV